MKYAVSGFSCGITIAFLSFGLIPELFLRLEYFTALFVILIGMLISFLLEKLFFEKYNKHGFLYTASFLFYIALSFIYKFLLKSGFAAMFFSVLLLYIACGGVLPQMESERNNHFALSGSIFGFILGIAVEFLIK
ncbi:MAG: hypothetical protein VB120_04025 [Lachnospiraceae bacterium]|nr:hypothetical protein [Lachnospiraceae bacterium]